MSYHSSNQLLTRPPPWNHPNAHAKTLRFPRVRSVCLQCPTVCVHTFRACFQEKIRPSFCRAQAQKAQGAGPRCIHSADIVKLDIQFRRMIRCVVGAPSSICWRDPWHEILHIWNQRVREMVEACHIHGLKIVLINIGNVVATS